MTIVRMTRFISKRRGRVPIAEFCSVPDLVRLGLSTFLKSPRIESKFACAHGVALRTVTHLSER